MKMIARFAFASSFLAAMGLAIIGPADAGEISSLYTSLDLEKKCKLVKTFPNEGGGALWDCKGHKGLRVRVAEGDLRFFVSFGENADKQTASQQTLIPFNYIHKTLEWRVERTGGAWIPFATILRYYWDSDGRKGQTLVVTKIGKNDACHVAHILVTGNKHANKLARMIADKRARGFDCKNTQALRFGPGGELRP